MYRSKNRLRHFFEFMLKGALRMPKFSMLIVVIILGVTVYFVQFLSIELFPYADKDIVYIDLFAEIAAEITGKKHETVLSEMAAYEKHIEHGGFIYNEVSDDFAEKARAAARLDPAGFTRWVNNGASDISGIFFRA